LKHAIVRNDIDYQPAKTSGYKNDKGCVEELYKFAAVSSASHHKASEETHGILKKPGEENTRHHPDHLAFDDQNVVEE
jgi:hypothetical protein